jgi:tRNA-dihydrouridine synthase 3
MESIGCAGVMIGRWALAKPWIFREFAEQRDLEPDVDGRLAVVQRYVELCREHFRDDEMGRRRTRRFVIFHQDFFRRYRQGAADDAVNSDDPRDWGAAPENEMERWLCRADLPAAEALCDWLVDGQPCRPPAEPEPDAPRAVKVAAHG